MYKRNAVVKNTHFGYKVLIAKTNNTGRSKNNITTVTNFIHVQFWA